jgi:hypothetical protein
MEPMHRTLKLHFEGTNLFSGGFDLRSKVGVVALSLALLLFVVFQKLTPHRLAQLVARFLTSLAQLSANPIQRLTELAIHRAPLLECRMDFIADFVQRIAQAFSSQSFSVKRFIGPLECTIPGFPNLLARWAEFLDHSILEFLQSALQSGFETTARILRILDRLLDFGCLFVIFVMA